MSTRSKEEIERITNEMGDYQISRWTALLHGIEKIADMAEAKRLDFDTIHIDQPALDKYVDEISDDVLFAMQSNQILDDINTKNASTF